MRDECAIIAGSLRAIAAPESRPNPSGTARDYFPSDVIPVALSSPKSLSSAKCILARWLQCGRRMVLETPRGHAVLSVAEGKAMVPLAAARNLDPEIVLAQGDGDWTLLREVVDIFREDAPRMLSEIRRCLVAKDGPGLERSAHALKGCVANLGARDAVEAALALELMGRDGTVAGAEARLDDLEREVDSMERLLVRMCEEAPA